jgi:hypothetical protein
MPLLPEEIEEDGVQCQGDKSLNLLPSNDAGDRKSQSLLMTPSEAVEKSARFAIAPLLETVCNPKCWQS